MQQAESSGATVNYIINTSSSQQRRLNVRFYYSRSNPGKKKSHETRMHPQHDSGWQVSLLRVTGKLENNEELHKEQI